MKYLVVLIGLLIALSVSGCFTWQANRGSDAVDINPLALGSDTPAIQPTTWQGYSNGREGLRLRD
jgi:hypothetical protein